MSNPTSELTFPLALRNGSLVSPSEVKRGDIFTCPDPEHLQPMIVRNGQVRREHFAHKQKSGKCSGEGALHNATKLAIKDRFDKAQEEGGSLFVIILRVAC